MPTVQPSAIPSPTYPQQHGGLAHHGPANGQHLLLSSGKGPRRLPGSLLQPGEEAIYLLQRLSDLRPVFPGVRAHRQVFIYGESGEDLPPFGGKGDAPLHDLVVAQAGDLLPVQLNGAASGADQPGYGI